MWDTVNQLFGISGLVATMVELIYTLTNRESFTEFERAFFDTTSGCEVMAEIYLLSIGLLVLRDYGFSWNILRLLAKDPVHILAGIKLTWNTPEGEKVTNRAALVAIVGSTQLVGMWAAFFPVWDSKYTGDEGLRWALSICSTVLILAHLLIKWFYRGDKKFELYYSLISLRYIMQKAFELCILLSNTERLLNGTMGELLVGFQVTEIFSVSAFLFHWWVYDGPQRWYYLRTWVINV